MLKRQYTDNTDFFNFMPNDERLFSALKECQYALKALKYGRNNQFNSLLQKVDNLEYAGMPDALQIAKDKTLGLLNDAIAGKNPAIPGKIVKLDEQKVGIAGFMITMTMFFIKDDSPADRIVNLTQDQASEEQLAAGIIEPANKADVQAALTFDAPPVADEIAWRAAILAAIARNSGCKSAMIGGAPYLMSALEKALIKAGIKPLYAFSMKESVELIEENGVVIKTNVFRHTGFVEIESSTDDLTFG